MNSDLCSITWKFHDQLTTKTSSSQGLDSSSLSKHLVLLSSRARNSTSIDICSNQNTNTFEKKQKELSYFVHHFTALPEYIQINFSTDTFTMVSCGVSQDCLLILILSLLLTLLVGSQKGHLACKKPTLPHKFKITFGCLENNGRHMKSRRKHYYHYYYCHY